MKMFNHINFFNFKQIKKMGIKRNMRNEETESSDEDSPQPTRHKKNTNKNIPNKKMKGRQPI